ncbi:NAD(P)H-dependent oxidoreductase [Rhodococcoides kyotonense]|uniref:NAD(P)H dehydrogenase (Quinone) n=1 Tax=Rhodococcoides kyotonense TaxID=398843 RepID=A0A239KG79_9NOCA|nr:NAD(P)H-dependent oxidoreductase [Rhodococcus kyotonensis]SNT17337.1 NAD(P)H dehydrogenase (quinone) [Rhodococcus kyotonensis]
MNSLVVVAHPDPNSLTHHVAHATADALRTSGGGVDIADLATEGFDPRFDSSDLDFYRGTGSTPEAVAAEQQRIDRADHLILVFPMYWWSFPALLKGWIDRVFVNGWAFDYTPGSSFEKKLERLTIHLVPVAGDDADSFERHRIHDAIRIQMEHGIIEYCGATVGSTTILHGSDTKSRDTLADDVHSVATTVAGRVLTKEPADCDALRCASCIPEPDFMAYPATSFL